MMKKSELKEIIRQTLRESGNEKQKIIKHLIKKGANPKDAKKDVDKHYDYVSKKYKDAPIAKKAEVIVSLHETQVTEGKKTADAGTLRFVQVATDKNQHSEARTMAASLLNDHRLTNIYRAIGQIVELLGNAPPEVLKLRGRMDKMLKAGLQKQYENWEEIWKRL